MSVKRHIKDVHFRNQNTYVICPQCCKQYASQNSLYSHLNRVRMMLLKKLLFSLISWLGLFAGMMFSIVIQLGSLCQNCYG